MKLNDFRLLVNDFAASFHFWHEIVGLSTIFRDQNNTYAELDAGNVRLELLRADYFAASVGSPLPVAVQDRKRSEEHTSELQSHSDLVCRLLLEKKKKQ